MVSVLLFVPNLIGYVRVLTALASLLLAFDKPFAFVGLYAFSMGLDAVDGVAARALNQTSRFGAVLDMVTDRISTASLLAILSHLYPSQSALFIALMVLDVGSHWIHMCGTQMAGASSHKTAVKNPLLRFYYSFPALFCFCVLNEACLLLLYLLHHTYGPVVPLPEALGGGAHLCTAAFYFTLPFMCMKQLFSLVQMMEAVWGIVALDEADRAAESQLQSRKAQ